MAELMVQKPSIELVDGPKCYPTALTLTGAVSSVGTLVTGTGTKFLTELFETDDAVAKFPFATKDNGNWNASTNTPALTGSSGTEADMYTVSVAGNTVLDGNSSFAVGDKIAFYGGKWIKASRYNRELPLKYEYLYSEVNCEIRKIVAVSGDLALEIETAFTVNLSSEDVLVPDCVPQFKAISINPTGAGGIVGTVNNAAVTIASDTVVNFENDAGLTPVCVDGTANDLQITTQI